MMKSRTSVFAVALMTLAGPLFAEDDPKGDAADAARDIVSAAVSASGDAATVEIELAGGQWNFDAVQIFLDTAPGGFALGGGGFEFMVEGATVYRYGGKGDDWTWARVGEARRQQAGTKLTTQIPKALLKAEKAKVLVRTLTSDWQTAIDTAPDKGTLALDFGAPAGPTDAARDGATAVDINDPADDAAEATLDITRLQASQEGAELVFQVTAKTPGDFGTHLIFLDTDTDPGTGFLPPADPKYGFELLINGEQLMKHAGGTRDAWQWENIAPVRRSVEGETLTVRIDAAAVKSEKLDVAVWAMSRDWQTLVDRAPDGGLATLAVDKRLLPAAKPAAMLAPPKPNRALPARERVRQAKSYYCYYGTNRTAELSHYDVVVLHTPQMKSEDVRTLSNLGVVTVGYLSVGEDGPPAPRAGDGTGPGGFASWYFDKNNDNLPDQNPIWLSYYANANDPKFRADRVAEARRLVEAYGFDGIFLDTIDTSMLNPESAPGMVQLVKDLREALPEAPIVLNQGYPLLPQLAPIADALMLESFTATYDFESKTYMMNYPQSIDAHLSRVRKEVLPVLEKHPLKVFVLDYAPENERERIQEAANRAATFGFLFAAAPISLDAVYANNIVGTPDPKWLEKMATPESMAMRLPRSANGFAAGTMILPSSCFGGYKVDALVDGVADRSTLHWSKAAWASAEESEEAWVEFRLPEPVKGGVLKIDWEPSHPSRAFTVEVKSTPSAEWTSVSSVQENASTTTTIALPADAYQGIRVRQQPGDGSPLRPNLMWIAQVSLVK